MIPAPSIKASLDDRVCDDVAAADFLLPVWVLQAPGRPGLTFMVMVMSATHIGLLSAAVMMHMEASNMLDAESADLFHASSSDSSQAPLSAPSGPRLCQECLCCLKVASC